MLSPYRLRRQSPHSKRWPAPGPSIPLSSFDYSSTGAPPLRVGIQALTPVAREQAAALLDGTGAEACVPAAEAVQALLYAAQTPQEQVLLLEPTLSPHPRALLLDLNGAIGAETAALLGFLGYLPPAVPPRQLGCGLREVAEGLAYAPEPGAGLFHQARAAGPLDPEARQLLHLAGMGCTQEQMQEALHLSRPTLQRRVRTLKRRLGLDPRLPLILAAERLGFFPAAGVLTPRR